MPPIVPFLFDKCTHNASLKNSPSVSQWEAYLGVYFIFCMKYFSGCFIFFITWIIILEEYKKFWDFLEGNEYVYSLQKIFRSIYAMAFELNPCKVYIFGQI